MFSYLKSFLENIDASRDRLLFPFIKKYWPRRILPNHLSVLRFFLALSVIYLLLAGFENGFWLMVIFVFAALLDLFDGSVARALDETTDLGAILDSLADKTLIIPVALFILIKFRLYLILFLIILPEIISGSIAFYFRTTGRIIKTTIFGKVKMVFECFGFAIIILFNYPRQPSLFPVILLYIAALCAFLSIIHNYLYRPLKIQNVKTI